MSRRLPFYAMLALVVLGFGGTTAGLVLSADVAALGTPVPFPPIPLPQGADCGCRSPTGCTIPCSSCCEGATPTGCPPPDGKGHACSR